MGDKTCTPTSWFIIIQMLYVGDDGAVIFGKENTCRKVHNF